MIDTPQKNSKRLLTLALLALFTTPMAIDTLADEPRVDAHKVVSKRQACPEIKIGDGQNVHWLGYSKGAFLGVELTDLSPELRSHFGVPGDAGVMVSRVVDDSAAKSAGLAVGDIITQVDGKDVASSNALGRTLRGRQGGDSVAISFWRDGGSRHTTATLAEHERCAFDVGDLMEGMDLEGLSELGLGISEEVLKGLKDAFEGQDWSKHFETLENLHLEGIEGLEGQLEGLKALEGLQGLEKLEGLEALEGLEERMERVQERLQHLEQEVEREVERKLRSRERNRERGASQGTDLEESHEDSAEDLETMKL